MEADQQHRDAARRLIREAEEQERQATAARNMAKAVNAQAGLPANNKRCYLQGSQETPPVLVEVAARDTGQVPPPPLPFCIFSWGKGNVMIPE